MVAVGGNPVQAEGARPPKSIQGAFAWVDSCMLWMCSDSLTFDSKAQFVAEGVCTVAWVVARTIATSWGVGVGHNRGLVEMLVVVVLVASPSRGCRVGAHLWGVLVGRSSHKGAGLRGQAADRVRQQ